VRRSVTDGFLDLEKGVHNPAGTNLVEMFLRVGESIRNQEVFKV
jgi:hypothetical protein